jgi:hypothetical protein
MKIHRLSRLVLATLVLPLAALAEPADILKFRFRGEGVAVQLGTPPNACVEIIDRGVLRAAMAGAGKTARTPAASFYMAVYNSCTDESLVIYGQMEAPALAMTVADRGRTIALRGTLPITTENLTTGSKVSEQLIFDLVFNAGTEGRRRRQGFEHVELQDRGFSSITTYDQREYANVTAAGSFSGTVAGLPVGMGNIGNFVIQTEQDRAMQVHKF